MATITSPLPGVFYLTPGPDKDPFINAGDRVEVGQAVGLIEVMKQFTEIRSDVAGTVASVAVQHGASVTPGAVLFSVDED